MLFSNILKRKREEKGLTQAEVAVLGGMPDNVGVRGGLGMSKNHSVSYHQDGVALDNVVVSNHDVLLSVHEGVAFEVENSEILVIQVNVRPALGGAGDLQLTDPAIAQLL